MTSIEMKKRKGNNETLHDLVMKRLDRYVDKENHVETPLLSTDKEESETKSKIEKFGETPANSECFKIVM